MDYRRKRIRVLVDTWSEMMRHNIDSRDKAIELLQKMYAEAGVEPIRGASNPPDLYDKEMISLYVIGKWGLGLDKELDKTFFSRIFGKEMTIEKFLEKLQNANTYEELCRDLEEVCKDIDDGFIARTLRFAFTLYYFGFKDENWFVEILKRLYRIAPQQFSETIRRFARFYIAYKVGEMIERGDIKNKMDLNLAKNLLAINLSIPKAVPNNNYIIDVAKHYFTIPRKLMDEIVSSRG